MKRLLAVLAFALSGVLWADIVNIFGSSEGGAMMESLRVPLNGVVVVNVPTGQRALIQFTEITDSTAEYRWKYRRSKSSVLETGKGSVRERYERSRPPDGNGDEVMPLPGHDVVVRAGEIRAEWSAAGDGFSYFYFNRKRAEVTLAGAEAFEKDP